MTTAYIIQTIIAMSLNMGFDPNVALAIAKTESNFNNMAVGTLGEQGVFQLRSDFYAPSCHGQSPFTWAVSNLWDVKNMTKPKVLKSLKYKYEITCGQELRDVKYSIKEAIKQLKAAKRECGSVSDNHDWVVCYNYGIGGGLKVKNRTKVSYFKKFKKNLVAVSSLVNQSKMASNFDY